MSNYKKMYSKLVVAMSNSIETMQIAMQEAEEIYISEENQDKFPLKITGSNCNAKD